MRYKTYAEAKIANPDSEIVTTGKNWIGHYSGYYSDQKVGTFEKQGCHIISESEWVICNPADYCSSVKEFLEAGFEFSVGDFWLNEDGIFARIYFVGSGTNKCQDHDENRYILSAAALIGDCKIPAKAEQWTIHNNTVPLCELSDEQKSAIFNSWVKDGARQRFNHGKFVDICIDDCNWHTGVVYRIKQKSELEIFTSQCLYFADLNGATCDESLIASIFEGIKSGDIALPKDGE